MSLANVPATFGLLTLLVTLLSGRPLFIFSTSKELRNTIRLGSALLLSSWLNDCIISRIIGYRNGMREGNAGLWMAPCKSPLEMHIEIELLMAQCQTMQSVSSKPFFFPIGLVERRPFLPPPAA